ncbi:fimbrial protein [Photobacterium damselae]|uniref:fimbrial protein n=1 Tax=Photobacterium damselae TaxID=38293 RepID=UPI004068C49D
MKKHILPFAIASLFPLFANAAPADNAIHFYGNVLDATCKATVTDAITGSTNMVALGDVSLGGTTNKLGTEVPFIMTLTDGNGGACTTAGTNAIVSFNGDFGPTGLLNQGTATGAVIKIKDVEGSKDINEQNTTVTNTLVKFKDGVKFTAQIDASANGVVPGSVENAITYTISYN